MSVFTGVQELDAILVVLLSTSVFVGGVIGFVLDNTIPGMYQMIPANFNRLNNGCQVH